MAKRIHVPRFRVATLEEVAHYGQRNLPRGLRPPIMGAAGPAVVGTPGVLSVTGGNTANTPAWGTGESRTSGNLGILFVAGTASSTTVSVPTVTGWTVANGAGVSTNGAWIFSRALTGSDTAPTVPAQTNTSWKCSLVEFTLTGVVVDQSGVVSSGTTSATATSGAANNSIGELIVAVGSAHFSSANTITDTFGGNHVASYTEVNNNSTSAAHHTSQGYGVGGNNASADTAVYTPSATATVIVVAIASFKLPRVTGNAAHRFGAAGRRSRRRYGGRGRF